MIFYKYIGYAIFTDAGMRRFMDYAGDIFLHK